MGLHGNPDEIAFRFHWAGIQQGKQAGKRPVSALDSYAVAGNSEPQEDDSGRRHTGIKMGKNGHNFKHLSLKTFELLSVHCRCSKLIVLSAHNPKVGGSNPPPATTYK